VEGFFNLDIGGGSLEEELRLMNKLIDLKDVFGPTSSDDVQNDQDLMNLLEI